jgi:hypothetical protein
VIKIRYADLPGGLHVRVAASGKDTIIYLLPGLTAVQRRAALRRARSSARMGHGPDLPGAAVAGAVMADGVRTTLRNVAGAMRIHPGLFFPPIVIISFAAVAYILLVSVTAGAHSPQVGGPGGGPGEPMPQGVAPPPGSQAQAPAPRPAASSPGRSGKPGPSPAGAHHTTAPSPSASPRPSATAPGTTPEPSPSATPTQPAPSPSSSPRPDSPDPGGIVAKASGSGGSQLCLHVGPLGACLSMSSAR